MMLPKVNIIIDPDTFGSFSFFLLFLTFFNASIWYLCSGFDRFVRLTFLKVQRLSFLVFGNTDYTDDIE